MSHVNSNLMRSTRVQAASNDSALAVTALAGHFKMRDRRFSRSCDSAFPPQISTQPGPDDSSFLCRNSGSDGHISAQYGVTLKLAA